MKFKLNTPIPQTLPKECQKAARILRAFVDNRNHGLDGVIPRTLLEQAKGFAIFSVFKAGFVLSARAGSGVVVAKLHDGTWSAPSAIGTAGMGVGGQAGAEVTDFLIILNSQAAVRSFMSAGSLTLGGNVSIALGPLGRNGEASSSVNTNGKVAMMYSYSQSRGLFGGVSVEGSVIVERQDANSSAYGAAVTCKMLLTGAVPAPPWAEELYRTLEASTGLPGGRTWITDSPTHPASSYAFGPAAASSPSPRPSLVKKKRSSMLFPPAAWGKRKDSGSFFESNDNGLQTTSDVDYFSAPDTNNRRQSMIVDTPKSSFSFAERSSGERDKPFKDSISSEIVIAKAVAKYDFQALQPGDLGFKKGDTIEIIKMSDKTDDWWTGSINRRQGIFPANFVDIVMDVL